MSTSVMHWICHCPVCGEDILIGMADSQTILSVFLVKSCRVIFFYQDEELHNAIDSGAINNINCFICGNDHPPFGLSGFWALYFTSTTLPSDRSALVKYVAYTCYLKRIRGLCIVLVQYYLYQWLPVWLPVYLLVVLDDINPSGARGLAVGLYTLCLKRMDSWGSLYDTTMKKKFGLTWISSACRSHRYKIWPIFAVVILAMYLSRDFLRGMYLYHFPNHIALVKYLRDNLNCPSLPRPGMEIAQNITVVSAFFDLGPLDKGGAFIQDKDLYVRWASVLGRLNNPLVFYTDSVDFKNLVEKSRRTTNHRTTIIFIENRKQFWAFQLQDRIQQIFNDPSYPVFSPNTVLAEYSCTMHVKYDLLVDAINKDLYKTELFAWLDIGYFRDIVELKERFTLQLPCNFNSSKVAFNVVNPEVPLSLTPKDIIRGNRVWVGGGLFFAKKSVLLAFSAQYRKAIQWLLSQNLMNTDQQVIYSMFSDQGRAALKPSVDIQLYVHPFFADPWFYLGYLCLRFEGHNSS